MMQTLAVITPTHH